MRADGVLLSSLHRLARTLTVQDALLGRAWRATDFGLLADYDPDDPMRTAVRPMAGLFAQPTRA